MKELIANKVYYQIFDNNYSGLTQRYKVKGENDTEVKKNIDIVLKNFKADNLFLLNQVHKDKIVCDEDFVYDGTVVGDGSITTRRNMILGIYTADCVPLLLSDQEGNIIGAAHCGWKSAKINIIAKLVKMMREKGANKILAVIGPSIAQPSYEVSQDFYQDFIDDSVSYKKFFVTATRPKHYLFDLPLFVKSKLDDVDVEVIEHINEDTYTTKNKYPSYRRSFHNNEPLMQNILSTIVMK